MNVVRTGPGNPSIVDVFREDLGELNFGLRGTQMMRPLIIILVAGWAGAASAHHGITGQFDTTQTVELTGAVTDMSFINPHSSVYFAVVPEPGGTIIRMLWDPAAATASARFAGGCQGTSRKSTLALVSCSSSAWESSRSGAK